MQLLVLVFVGLSAAFVSGSCPSGWRQSLNKCLFASKDKATWFEAFSFCRSMGADLLEMKTYSDLNWVKSTLQDLDSGFWIGATDMFNEGQWMWMKSGSSMNLNYWYPGKPSDLPKYNCLSMFGPDRSREFNDGECNYRANFICEK